MASTGWCSSRKGLKESLRLFVLLLFHEGEFRAKTVAESVLPGGDFAFRGTGSCGLLGIAAIGFDLGLGGHG